MSRKIIFCTTFRDFTGSENDEIQLQFLKSIQDQSYKNFELCVTIFKEKNIEKVLKKFSFKYNTTYSSIDIWLSFTDTLLNGVKYLELGKNIFIWSNADNILDKNFFQAVINNFEKGCSGTSYPHITYSSLSDFKKKKPYEWYHGNDGKKFYSYDPNIYVPDIIFLDGDLLLEKKNLALLKKYPLHGIYPGIAQNLMTICFSKKQLNIFFKSKVHNIVNSAIEHKEKRNKYKSGEMDHNRKILNAFCIERELNKNLYNNSILAHKKIIQHSKYKIIGSFFNKVIFRFYFIYYAIFPRKSFILFNLTRRIVKKVL